MIDDVKSLLEWYRDIYGERLYINGYLSDPNLLPAKSPETTARQTQKSHKDLAYLEKAAPELFDFYQEIRTCQKCALGSSRKNFVFGVGNPQARVMLVGEAPGRDEDEQGLPFVGPAGKLLDKMLLAIGLKREDVFIANVLKCRPPHNRDPLPEEIDKCESYLIKQMEMVRPRILMALGRVAAQALLKTEHSLSQMRGGQHHYQDIPLIVTYHPAALLRNPRWKQNSWQDLKKLKKMLHNIKS